MKILFACGGTAGHIYPAIAVADELRGHFPDAKFLFVGAKGMMEEKLVPKAGYELKTVSITNLSREKSLGAVAHNVKTAGNLVLASGQARRIIRAFAPDAAVGTGGYVCYPVLSAARKMGIATLLHESNAVPGLTTRLLLKKVDCLMLGFEDRDGIYAGSRQAVFTGTPVRGGFLKMSREKARSVLSMPLDKPFVVSVWGSLGSAHMNNIIAQMIPYAAKNGELSILHSAGSRDYNGLMAKISHLGPDLEKSGIVIREYIHDMPLCMAAADLVVCRSGASTIAELQALSKPCVFVPSPNVTGGHQMKNAKSLEKIGACRVLAEGSFTARSLYSELLSLSRDEGSLLEMSRVMSLSGKNNACELIASKVLSFI